METNMTTWYKLSLLIAESLDRVNITLVPKFENQGEMKKTVTEMFTASFFSRNLSTVANFIKYCFKPLQVSLTKEYLYESEDWRLLIACLAGCLQGIGEVCNQTQDKKGYVPNYELMKAIYSLFTKDELQEIAQATKDMIMQLPNEVKEACIWMKKDISARKEQVDAVAEFAGGMFGIDGRKKLGSTELVQLAQKFMATVVPDSDITAHSIYLNQRREQLGILTPPKQLMVHIEYVLNFMDVLHNSLWFDKNEGDSFEQIHFTYGR